MTGPADGVAVNVEELRAHARKLAALKARFGAVKAASAHIANGDSAYGLLCSWMPAVLEGRHVRQDELIDYVEENLQLAVDGLAVTVRNYEAVESDTAGLMRKYHGKLAPS